MVDQTFMQFKGLDDFWFFIYDSIDKLGKLKVCHSLFTILVAPMNVG